MIQPYCLTLFSAMFAAAYYGLLRIGEVAKGPHVILAKNVQIGVNKPKLLFMLETSKTHTKGNKPQMVKIESKKIKQGNNSDVKYDSNCPFKLLQEFITVRPLSINKSEQFFVYSDQSPVTQSQTRETFSTAVNLVGLNPNAYSFHCFRSGRASGLLKLGFSVKTIKKIGRWKSHAVFTYLRM